MIIKLAITFLIVTTLPVYAVVRNVDLDCHSDQTVINEQSSIFMAQGTINDQQVPKRYIVKNNGKAEKVKEDAIKNGGTFIMSIDSQDATVVSFEYADDVAAFTALGYSDDMERDPPRFSMRSRASKNVTSQLQAIEALMSIGAFPDLNAAQEIP